MRQELLEHGPHKNSAAEPPEAGYVVLNGGLQNHEQYDYHLDLNKLNYIYPSILTLETIYLNQKSLVMQF